MSNDNQTCAVMFPCVKGAKHAGPCEPALLMPCAALSDLDLQWLLKSLVARNVSIEEAYAKLRQAAPSSGSALELEEDLRSFVRGCASSYDCDGGPNGAHPYYCRKCAAEALAARFTSAAKETP